MNFEFFDGFKSGGYDLWDSWTGTPVVTTVSGMDGYCLFLNATETSVAKAISAANDYYFAFKMKPTYPGLRVISFYNGATLLGYLDLSSGMVLSAYAGPSTLLASAVANLTLSQVYLIEIYYKPHSSAGIFQVKVNGGLVISVAAATAPSTLQINKFAFRDSSAAGAVYFGDVMVADAWIGNKSIQGIVPNAVGATTEWTPSVGNNYSCVDEVPASDTDYTVINAIDKLDTFGASDLSGVIANVLAIQVQARCVQEGAPTPLNIKMAIRSGGVDYLSGDYAVPTTTPKSLAHIWNTNPLDSSPWLEAEIDAAEIGYKSAT